ncbi:hypothetical protein [Fodinibius sp. Rm-B-1B1-1]|uniref:hypothetical protein n=1 Tax=Fodinibius alkaliphilus TaxID=3140241 RepID=UPI003159BB6B
MRKVFLSIIFLSFLTTISLAQPSIKAGLNIAESTNVGFVGLNPTLEVEQRLISNISANVTLNGFWDFNQVEEYEPLFKEKSYHRSFYSDLGLNIKIIDKAVDWSIGAGGSYQVGVEKYVDTAGWRDGQLQFYDTRKTNFSRFGILISNTIGFGKVVNLNINIYRFNFWGEYMSIGTSFNLY